MFTQTPTQIKSRFTALQYRETPHFIPEALQTRAAALAPKVREIKPGVYTVGGQFVDLWIPGCTCRAHRVRKQSPCAHRLALWLANGVQLDDPDPTAHLRKASIERPAIIAWYATIPVFKNGVIEWEQARRMDPFWWMCLNSGDEVKRTYHDLYYLTPFYL